MKFSIYLNDGTVWEHQIIYTSEGRAKHLEDIDISSKTGGPALITEGSTRKLINKYAIICIVEEDDDE